MADFVSPPPAATEFDAVSWIRWLNQIKQLYEGADLSQFSRIPPPPEGSPYLKSDNKQVSWEWLKWLIDVRRGLNVILEDAEIVIDCILSGGGGIPIPTGAGDLFTGTRTISGVDSDYVTLLEKTTPHSVWGQILVTRPANATAGQVVSYRVYVDEILVDERSITWPGDAGNTRCAALLIRSPGSVSVANTSEEKVGGDTFTASTADLGNSTAGSTANQRNIVHGCYQFSPKKIRIEMKGTTITVSNTFGARFYGYPVSTGGNYWADLVRSYRGDRTKLAGAVADSDYVTLLEVTGPAQLMSPIYIRQTTTAGVVDSAPAYKTEIDGFDMREIQTTTGSSTQWLVLEGHGGLKNPFSGESDSSPIQRGIDFWTLHLGPKFNNSFKLKMLAGAIPGGNGNDSYRAEVLIGHYT